MENFVQMLSARSWGLAVMLFIAAASPASSAETNTPPEPASTLATNASNATNVVSSDAGQQLRSYLKLQEQLHITLLAIEEARRESSLEARTNAEILATRLELLERTLEQQRDQQIRSSRTANENLLLIGGGIVGLGLVALILTSFYQSRGMNRLAEVANGFQNDRALIAGTLSAGFDAPDRLMIGGGGSPGAGNQALLTTIGRLERRVQELEHTAHPVLTVDDATQSNGRESNQRNGASGHPPADHLAVLMSKGHVLLSLGKADEALTCFDEAIAASPNLAEAHLKKGMALERLKRADDAIKSYDRALALNKALTQAYLSKGGIYNQQERYNEALECYEQALRSETRS